MRFTLPSVSILATFVAFSLALPSDAAGTEFKKAIEEGISLWGGAPKLEIQGEITGPDGLIYWFTGGSCYSFTTAEGRHYHRPNEAGVFRCDPDGSNVVEVFRGLRAPRELAFDALGNLFAYDLETESADSGRLFYLLEGGDAGWRGNWIDTALALPPVGFAPLDSLVTAPDGAGFQVIEQKSDSPAPPSSDRILEIREIGKQARKDESRLPALVELLSDSDTEIRAQAARALADTRTVAAGKALVRALADESPRVRAFAAIGVGKCRIPQALEKLLAVLSENENRDVFLRHACVQGMWYLNEREKILKKVGNDSAAVRLGVLLTLRKLGDPRVKYFLDDAEEGIRIEAERAVAAQDPAANSGSSRG